MNSTFRLYGRSLALLTDLYQLTMACGYWKLGTADRQAAFHLSFRTAPFSSGFTVACGLATIIDYVQNFALSAEDLAYLATISGEGGQPLFDPGFLEYLRAMHFACDLDAVPEGTVVFAHEPLVRVQGPLLHCQLLETVLLNLINFPTLVATKAARLCIAARGEPVLEFGLRRAQGIDGGLTASRAAYIGGCAATSNVLAGKIFGIPVKGTHAHSWIMSFDSELEAFDAYARAMPNNCVFLVDTYNTLQGVRHAVEIGRKLKAAGHKLLGIRLDSGDLAYLSIEARKILDAAGFKETAVLATNDLDEDIIRSLKEQQATISVWGVGTKLVTAYDQAALGGVFKLSAIRNPQDTAWQHKIKLSEQLAKTSLPGILQIRRFRSPGPHGENRADMIFDEITHPASAPATRDPAVIVDPLDATRRKAIPHDAPFEDLLVPIFRGGKCVYDPPPLASIRQRTQTQLAGFHPGIKRGVNPHQYPVGLERSLFDLRQQMILAARGVFA